MIYKVMPHLKTILLFYERRPEGQRLFVAHGLKRVTVDELSAAAQIAKATFYTFYDSKEALHLDIVLAIQQSYAAELDALLKANAAEPPRERVRQVFAALNGLQAKYPILSQITEETVALVARKVKQAQLGEYASQRIDVADTLIRHGIRFTVEPPVVSQAFMALYHGWMSLHGQPPEMQAAVTDILLNGLIDQIVIEQTGDMSI